MGNSSSRKINKFELTYVGDDKTIPGVQSLIYNLLEEKKENVNILLLGGQGAGKSTLINSMFMALDKHGYREYASHGNGAQETYTKFIKKYKFGSENPEYKRKVTFWDCPGFANVSGGTSSRFLELILDGYVPCGPSMHGKLSEVTIKELGEKFPTPDDSRAIHLVLLVVDPIGAIPKNLLQAVRETTRSDQREVPVLAVITKIDKITDQEKADKVIGEVFYLSGFDGAAEKTFKTMLYCSDLMEESKKTGTRDMRRVKEIDIRLCALWKRILDPAYTELVRYH